MTKHKWHKEIKAWADGAEIEQKHEKYTLGKWEEFNGLWGDFVGGREFRIKPQPKEPQYLYVWQDGQHNITLTTNPPHLLQRKQAWCQSALNTSNVKVIGKIKLEVDDD